MDKLYNVGAYIRLSKESVAYRSEESLSIENQRLMLGKFIALMPGWIERKYYIDDGFSGGSFDRPAFVEMMEDIRQGKINLLLVKDLSRFGRNYLEAGRYLEQELPALGCRFVSLSEGIDTETGEDDIIPFLNAMNDHYLKNLSERIKSVLTAKAKDGQKLSGYAPYGYTRSRSDKTRLIVDDFAAEVVRLIFSMRVQGIGYGKIAAALNEKGILPPRLYYYVSQNREPPALVTELWFTQTVKAILGNEIYTGNTVAFKLGTRSYRDGRPIKKDPEDWIRVNNTHEALISAEVWRAVQEMAAAAKAKVAHHRAAVKSLFSGLLVCAGCGKTLVGGSETHKRKSGREVTYHRYHCRTKLLTGGTGCTSHTIYEMTLKQVLLAHIREQARLLELDEAVMLEALHSRLTGKGKLRLAEIREEARSLEQRIHKLDVLVSELYEGRLGGSVSEDVFGERLAALASEKQAKEERLAHLRQAERETAARTEDVRRWAAVIREKSALEDVDRELLDALIEKIEVGERRVEDGVKRQDIRIFYRFVGLL